MSDIKKKVLIIEDDEMISSMYKTKLNQEGFEIHVANNGAEGIEKTGEVIPDLILLDIIMPMVDGFSVLETLRAKPEYKEISIIMLTNLGTEEDRAKGSALGANDYLVKASLTPTQVSDKIKEYLL